MNVLVESRLLGEQRAAEAWDAYHDGSLTARFVGVLRDNPQRTLRILEEAAPDHPFTVLAKMFVEEDSNPARALNSLAQRFTPWQWFQNRWRMFGIKICPSRVMHRCRGLCKDPWAWGKALPSGFCACASCCPCCGVVHSD